MNMLLHEMMVLDSIKFGDAYIRSAHVETQIANSIRPVILHDTNHPNYPGLSGSCTLLKYQQKCFVVCTRHQLSVERGPAPSMAVLNTIRFLNWDGTSNIPFFSVWNDKNNETEAFHDIIIFAVKEDWDGLSAELPHFFPIDDLIKKPKHFSYRAGCPTIHNDIKYEVTPQEISFKVAVRKCKFNVGFNSQNKFYRQYTYPNEDNELDGMSGGSIFSFVGEPSNWYLVFDGIIIRASGGYVHIVDAYFIQKILKFMITATSVSNF